jgi:hypothetical protein
MNGAALGRAVGLALLLAARAGAAPVPFFTSDDQYRGLQHGSSADQRARGWRPDARRVVHYVRPAEADPAVRHYLRDNIALLRPDLVTARSALLVYFPGTGGAPDHSKMLLGTAAARGYRVIGLMYDDMPATAQACQHDPDPTCSGRFRARRIFGDPVSADIDDPPAETVVARLAATLRWLAGHYPGEGWEAYLDADGAPAWPHIAVAGHSQGAGIAAFIAKRHEVARVVLFSSPWDYYHGSVDGTDQRIVAPWLAGPGATPRDRWFAALHAAEPQARNILRAYRTLAIPAAHVHLLRLPPRGGHSAHGSLTSDFGTPLLPDGSPAYLADWQALLGAADRDPSRQG